MVTVSRAGLEMGMVIGQHKLSWSFGAERHKIMNFMRKKLTPKANTLLDSQLLAIKFILISYRLLRFVMLG